MTQTLKIFISSPSDLGSERSVAAEVIQDLNSTWSEFLGVSLEGVRWETHARPGIASDPQQVINRQIPQDYDIYLGILWKRFGTPTARHASGTQEEFEQAYRRFKKGRKRISLLFYFKDEPVPPTQIDTAQLEEVNKFRKLLSSKGVLYWSFNSTEQFRQIVRLHLSREVQAMVKRHRGAAVAAGSTAPLGLSLESLEGAANAQQERVLALIEETMDSLDDYENRLSKVLEAPPSKWIDVLAKATRAYSERVHAVSARLTQTLEEAVEAWVNLFMAYLLLGMSPPVISKKFFSNFRELSNVFKGQAKRYRTRVMAPPELLSLSRFRTAESTMHLMHIAFADEMLRAAAVLDDASRIIRILQSRKDKGCPPTSKS